MMQIINMTYDEKVEMYKKYTKEQIIDMLINANNVICQMTKRQTCIDYENQMKNIQYFNRNK